MSRLAKIRQIWNDKRLSSLPGASGVSPDTIFHAAVSADPTPQKKMLSWLLLAWERRTFRWEDIRSGSLSNICDDLKDFEVYKKNLPVVDRSLNRYSSPGELWEAIKDVRHNESSSRYFKKEAHLRAEFESLTWDFPSGLKCILPLTLFASRFWGKGTRWCTAAEKDNMFWDYSSVSPLLIFMLPDNKKFQASVDWDYCYSLEFRNARDDLLTPEDVAILSGYQNDITHCIRKAFLCAFQAYRKYTDSMDFDKEWSNFIELLPFESEEKQKPSRRNFSQDAQKQWSLQIAEICHNIGAECRVENKGDAKVIVFTKEGLLTILRHMSSSEQDLFFDMMSCELCFDGDIEDFLNEYCDEIKSKPEILQNVYVCSPYCWNINWSKDQNKIITQNFHVKLLDAIPVDVVSKNVKQFRSICSLDYMTDYLFKNGLVFPEFSSWSNKLSMDNEMFRKFVAVYPHQITGSFLYTIISQTYVEEDTRVSVFDSLNFIMDNLTLLGGDNKTIFIEYLRGILANISTTQEEEIKNNESILSEMLNDVIDFDKGLRLFVDGKIPKDDIRIPVFKSMICLDLCIPEDISACPSVRFSNRGSSFSLSNNRMLLRNRCVLGMTRHRIASISMNYLMSDSEMDTIKFPIKNSDEDVIRFERERNSLLQGKLQRVPHERFMATSDSRKAYQNFRKLWKMMSPEVVVNLN